MDLTIQPPLLTVVIPTFNEEGNIAKLVKDIGTTLSVQDVSARILFVDDSQPIYQQGRSLTVLAIERAAVQCIRSHPQIIVDVIHRKGTERVGGLSGAVIRGISEACSPLVAVMDGDGQHPPTVLAAMIEAFRKDVDIVIASRYVDGGDSAGLDGVLRRFVSRASTWLAKGMFPWRLRGISDPMTGCFMIRREMLRLDTMRPKGFKILLEILLAHELRALEVPMRFGARLTGDSKAMVSQGIIYLQRLFQLRFTTSH